MENKRLNLMYQFGLLFILLSLLALLILPVVYMPLNNPIRLSIYEVMFGSTINFLGLNYQIFALSPMICFIIFLLLANIFILLMVSKQREQAKLMIIFSLMINLILAGLIINLSYFLVEGEDYLAFVWISGLATQSVSEVISYGSIISSAMLGFSFVSLLFFLIKDKNLK